MGTLTVGQRSDDMRVTQQSQTALDVVITVVHALGEFAEVRDNPHAFAADAEIVAESLELKKRVEKFPLILW